MIQFKQKYESPESIGINMLPLVDIIFNLLIFFLITATISTKGINLDLPNAVSAKATPAKNQEIVLNEKGEIYFNKARMTLERLDKILTAESKSPDFNSTGTIVLKAHQDVNFGLFVSIMDVARKSGFSNLIIATDQK